MMVFISRFTIAKSVCNFNKQNLIGLLDFELGLLKMHNMFY